MTRVRRRPVRRLIRMRFRNPESLAEAERRQAGLLRVIRPREDIPHPPTTAQNNYVAVGANWGRNQRRGPRPAGAALGNRNAALSPEAAAARAKLAEVKARAALIIARLKLLTAQAKMLARSRAVVVHNTVENGVLLRQTIVEYLPDGTFLVQRFAFTKAAGVSHSANRNVAVIPGRAVRSTQCEGQRGEGDPGRESKKVIQGEQHTAPFFQIILPSRPGSPSPRCALRACSAGDDRWGNDARPRRSRYLDRRRRDRRDQRRKLPA